MGIYKHKVGIMYIDFCANASPAELARIIIGDAVAQISCDGIPRDVLWKKCGAAWMVDKYRFSQQKNIKFSQNIEVLLSPRREKGVRIYYTAEVFCNNELVATAEISFFAVLFFERSILRLKELEKFWTTPALRGANMQKSTCHMAMEEKLRERVRFSDCDSNMHLSSPKYIDFICDAIGYWEDGESLFETMQIDYVSECRAGQELVMSVANDGEMTYVRGSREDGTVTFDSMFKLKKLKLDRASKE